MTKQNEPKKKKPPAEKQAVQVKFDSSIIPDNFITEKIESKPRRGKYGGAFIEYRFYIPVTIQTIQGEMTSHD